MSLRTIAISASIDIPDADEEDDTEPDELDDAAFTAFTFLQTALRETFEDDVSWSVEWCDSNGNVERHENTP